MTIPRRVTVEVLDHLAPDDPSARRSRRDLVRVHRAMGTRSLMARGWRHLFEPARTAEPLRILELGAGDGTLLLGLARRLGAAWPNVHLMLLDRMDVVAPATRAAFARLGWTVEVRVGDVQSWATQADAALAWPARPRWDLITATLFLHHFESRELAQLLTTVAARSDRFFACEPRRSWLALAGSHLVGALGTNAVTRGDAVLSVHAGFRDADLTAQWPRAEGPWLLREGAQGLFNHCFSAQRRTSP